MSILFEGVNQRGFGTWPLKGADAQQAVEQAIAAGYRAIDTAQMYENEEPVAAGIAASGLPRSEFCVTTKVHPDNFGAAEFLPSVEASIKKLGEVPDLLLLHWPAMGGDVVPGLKMLQSAFDKGMAKNIGVSNYTIAQMETANSVVDAPIAINQVEFHPLIDQSKLRVAGERLNIPLAAYCSVAKGRVLDTPELIEIGAAHEKTAAQVSLRWIMQLGVSPIAMSTNADRVAANFDIVDFDLNDEEMNKINELSKRVHQRIVREVPWAPEWDA
jgi:2,5-diketo-D-gluconate reductase B